MKTRRLIKDNPKQILKLLFKRIDCNYRDGIYSEMKKHPDFPSFLSFHHTLKKYGIDSIALETNIQDLQHNLPKPVIVHISSNDGMFLLLEKIDNDCAYFINEKNNLEKQPIEDFLKIWNGYALIVDSEYIIKTKETLIDKIKSYINYIINPFIIFTFLFLIGYSLTSLGNRSNFNLFYILEFGLGILFSVLLLIEHFDKHNLFVKNICFSKNNKKINCSSILNSKDAYFLGIFSWSDIGLIYFVILFVLSLFFPGQLSLSFSVFTSVFIFPYVFYSLYYQKFIAKSWCVLCLCIQGIILSIFVTSIVAFRHVNLELLLIPKNLTLLLILSFTTIALYSIIKPLIYSFVNLPSISEKFKSTIHNCEIKTVLFANQKSYEFGRVEKIKIGNIESSDCVTIIFSPICEPCLIELSKFLPFLKYKENTLVEFIFLVDKKESTLAFNIAKRMLKFYSSNKESFIAFLEEYVNNYPKSKHLSKYREETNETELEQIILQQKKWCISNKIYSTPQIFLNHKELPLVYNTADLDYLVT